MIGYFQSHIFKPGDKVVLKENIKIHTIQEEASIEKGTIGEIMVLRDRSGADTLSLYSIHFCSKDFDGDVLDIPEYLLSS